MSNEQIKAIFTEHKLPEPQSIQKVAVGFTNDVYSVDDTYILKVCKDVSNEDRFAREIALYSFFQNSLPVPTIVASDNSKQVIPSDYMIYQKIIGDNLYNVWHTFTTAQRRMVIKQLCDLLKIVNDTNLDVLPSAAHMNSEMNWKEAVLAKLNNSLQAVTSAGTITQEQAEQISRYVVAHSSALNEQKLALVYWDAHFDNILVSGTEIVGLIDFERTEVASIDFLLDIIKRMVEQPKKYMSEYAEQFAKTEDYADLMDWFKDFYPELFEFEDLSTRLNLYTIEHNLKDLEGWPHVTELIDGIMQIVNT